MSEPTPPVVPPPPAASRLRPFAGIESDPETAVQRMLGAVWRYAFWGLVGAIVIGLVTFLIGWGWEKLELTGPFAKPILDNAFWGAFGSVAQGIGGTVAALAGAIFGIYLAVVGLQTARRAEDLALQERDREDTKVVSESLAKATKPFVSLLHALEALPVSDPEFDSKHNPAVHASDELFPADPLLSWAMLRRVMQDTRRDTFSSVYRGLRDVFCAHDTLLQTTEYDAPPVLFSLLTTRGMADRAKALDAVAQALRDLQSEPLALALLGRMEGELRNGLRAAIRTTEFWRDWWAYGVDDATHRERIQQWAAEAYGSVSCFPTAPFNWTLFTEQRVLDRGLSHHDLLDTDCDLQVIRRIYDLVPTRAAIAAFVAELIGISTDALAHETGRARLQRLAAMYSEVFEALASPHHWAALKRCFDFDPNTWAQGPVRPGAQPSKQFGYCAQWWTASSRRTGTWDDVTALVEKYLTIA